MPRLFPACLAAFVFAVPAIAMPLEPDMFPDAPRGTLMVRMDISGSGRWSSQVGHEFTNFTASRTVDMQLLMVLSNEGRGPIVPIRGHDLTNPEMPEAQEVLANAIAECNGDLACQMETVQRFGEVTAAEPDAFGSQQWEEMRYENWVSDKSRPCASGNLAIEDSGDGRASDPPLPPQPFSYTRSGIQDLTNAPDDELRRICDAWLSYDSRQAVVSLRLPAYAFWVDAEYSGGYTGEDRIKLIEEGPSFVFSLDNPTEWNDDALSGTFTQTDIGVAYVNGGQVRAPLTATISWSLHPEMQ